MFSKFKEVIHAFTAPKPIDVEQLFKGIAPLVDGGQQSSIKKRKYTKHNTKFWAHGGNIRLAQQATKKRSYVKRSPFWDLPLEERIKLTSYSKAKPKLTRTNGGKDIYRHIPVASNGTGMKAMIHFNASIDDVPKLQPGEGVVVDLHRLRYEHKYRNFNSAQACAHREALEAGFHIRTLKVCRGSLMAIRPEGMDTLMTRSM